MDVMVAVTVSVFGECLRGRGLILKSHIYGDDCIGVATFSYVRRISARLRLALSAISVVATSSSWTF